MTKQLELKRIEATVEQPWSSKCLGAAQAQLQADQQVLDNVKQAIFDEMGKNNVISIRKGQSLGELGLLLTVEYWQALKKKFCIK